MATPKESWPQDLENSYQRLRPLGEGAYGTVWLASGKSVATLQQRQDRVAIKAIGSYDKTTRAYAKREISILREISHPNIIRLIGSYQDDADSMKKRPCTFLVLSFAPGPTLGSLIEKGGAIGLPLAQVLTRQLISAVSYLHSRAVLHRDIKPDNCIVTSRCSSIPEKDNGGDDELSYWGSGPEAEEQVRRKGYQLILIDFGFARALSPSDLQVDQESSQTLNRLEATGGEDIDSALQASRDESIVWTDDIFRGVGGAISAEKNPLESQPDKKPQRKIPKRSSKLSATFLSSSSSLYEHMNRSSRTLQASLKRKLQYADSRCNVSGLSSLGTRAYAAPEVIKNRPGRDCDHALTDRVADYSLAVDAYSVGMTLREMLTGVPPDENETKYIAKHQEATLSKILRRSRHPRGDHRGRKFRRLDQPKKVPIEAAKLVRELTASKVSERLTVMEAQEHAWILSGGGASSSVPFYRANVVDVLECAQLCPEDYDRSVRL